jgi:shikimate kinase
VRPTIALIGFMGAGKSCIGRLAASRLGVSFADTDEEVSRRHGPIPELFTRFGEAGFRELEREVVLDVLAQAARDGAVVALGGGAVLDPDVRATLSGTWLVAWLTAPADVMWRRIARGTPGDRPLAPDRATFERLSAERSAVYEAAADLVIVNDGSKTVEGVVDELTEALAPRLRVRRGSRGTR